MFSVVHFVLCVLIQKCLIFDIIIPFCPWNDKIIKLMYVCACKNGLSLTFCEDQVDCFLLLLYIVVICVEHLDLSRVQYN